MGPWGLYSTGNLAPCYLANRFKAQLFTFPLVIGQRRTESLLRPVTEADGKTHLRLQKVALERRSMGLAPMQAADDDRLETAAMLYGNRMARITEADADGLLWALHVPFAPAQLSQNIGGSTGGEETGWGAGDAIIALYPAFADPNMDGLLIRVTLRNRSQTAQTWFVDMLGGLSLLTDGFDLKDLKLQVDTDGKSSLLQHKSSDAAFALTADMAPYPVRAYTVSNTYFGQDGRLVDRDKNGVALPAGRVGAKDAPDETIAKAGKNPSSPTGLWALTRVDDISVAAGEEATFTLCIGVGKQTEDARKSASTLTLLAADSAPDGRPARSGAYSKALSAHRISQPPVGDPGLDHLLAQSYANVPFDNLRRVGVPSRQWAAPTTHGAYRPVEGGFIGLGWTDLRPDWAAAQLNAWFLTAGDANTPVKNPQTVAPINLFALWELYQQTLDHRLLERYYPYARRRYQEMLTAGRAGTNAWLFSWKTGMPEIDGSKDTLAAGLKGAVSRTYSPDYSAFVIRSARILQRMATVLEHSPNELIEYSHDAEAASQAMNTTLWDIAHETYVSRPITPADAPAVASDELTSLLPLTTGSDTLSLAQRAALLRRLTDPALFWSSAGLRSVAKTSPNYMSHDPGNGAVAFGTNWLLWKALLDLGETETARKLADNLMHAYRAAQVSTDACPEALDGDTGLACGATDVSGDACTLLDLHSAYHQVGNVSSGWNLLLLDRHYDRSADMLRIVFRSVEKNGAAAALCVMGKPNGKYTVQGATVSEVTADADGVVTLSLPSRGSTQELTVQPSAKP
ncbi:MAG: trehalase family protein [Chthonomonadaceae bacterium]|nr:trehalase family protein [Chthonomonadaceae bacterium]